MRDAYVDEVSSASGIRGGDTLARPHEVDRLELRCLFWRRVRRPNEMHDD
jgi:hypothetical protein